MSDSIIYCNEQNFKECVLDSEIPICLFFYSNQCPPCVELSLLIEEIAGDYKGKMKFVKIEAWENEKISDEYNIKITPTLIFFDKGIKILKRLTGAKSRSKIIGTIDKIFKIENHEVKKVINCDVLIIGGGPAGLSAGIFTARANLNTIIIDEAYIGGQVVTTYDISNYPGTNGSITGQELIKNMYNQAKNFGVSFEEFKSIEKVELKGKIKKVTTDDLMFRVKTIIIATGARPRKLSVQNEERFRGRGIHYCAICDGPKYKNKNVVVVGGGDSATEEAIHLAKIVSKITLLHQFDYFEASKTAVMQMKNIEGVNILLNSKIIGIEGERQLNGIVIENTKTKEVSKMEIDGVFVYIGNTPNSDLFKPEIKINKAGFIITDENMNTNVSGVFAVGDVREKNVRQIGTAVGDGIVAGVMCEKYIAKL